jgi:hypothetical protein
MKPRHLVIGAGLAFVLVFAAPVPAPQFPDALAQAPAHAKPCPPTPDPGGIWDFDPCLDYWSVVSTSARNTAALKELRVQLDAVDARIAKLEKENNNG